jgi:hypothetical protein
MHRAFVFKAIRGPVGRGCSTFFFVMARIILSMAVVVDAVP